jgi:RHS repeat-associated protein
VESNGTSRIQVYDQAGQLRYAVQTGGPNPAVTTKYIYLNRHMLAEVAGTTVQYSHSDALGSPVARTSAAGTVLTRTRYEPYGMTAAGTNPSGIGFTGHVNDTNTGLVYMQQRYYDPVAGRLLSIDPVVTDAVTGDSFNRYAYANNNPHRYTDPDGRDAAEKFVEQHRKDVESGKGATYKPLLPVAAAIGAPYAIATVIVGGPAIATATVATIKSLAPSAAKITTEVASKTETVLTNPKNLIPTQSKSEMTGSQVTRLAKDMKQNGFDSTKPISGQTTATGRIEIVDGHHRAAAAIKAGIEKVPVEVFTP